MNEYRGMNFLNFPIIKFPTFHIPSHVPTPEIAPITVPIEALRVENPKLERERERRVSDG
jgi:hypothetical protein